MRQGEIVAGRYILHRKLGEGGMGTVWQAAHTATERALAIKLLHRNVASSEDARKRFMREARASARINHPNIVDILDAGELEDGTLFLAMELLDGLPLSKALRATPTLSVQAFLMVLTDACRALAAAHAAGIVHRDVKPDNIYLHRERGSEYVSGKVLDFGISKFMGDLDGTTTGALVGSPHYMSPEQVKGEATVDHRSDIWALGVLMFRALSGKWPHTAENFTSLCVAIGVDPPANIDDVAPDLPEALRQLIRCCLSPLDSRLADAGQVADTLEHVATDPRLVRMTVAVTRRDSKRLIRSDSFRIRTPTTDAQRVSPTSMPGSVSQATVMVDDVRERSRPVWLWAGALVVVAIGGAAGAVVFAGAEARSAITPPTPTAGPVVLSADAEPAQPVDDVVPVASVSAAASASAAPSASAPRPRPRVRTRPPPPPAKPEASTPKPTGVPGEKLGSGI